MTRAVEVNEVSLPKISRNTIMIALYFRGPKLSRFEHAEQFHEIVFTISGMALNYIRVGSRYG